MITGRGRGVLSCCSFLRSTDISAEEVKEEKKKKKMKKEKKRRRSRRKKEEMVAAMLQGKERERCDPEYDGGMGNGREAAAIGGGSGVYKSRGYF